jgi:hypothetical protein
MREFFFVRLATDSTDDQIRDWLDGWGYTPALYEDLCRALADQFHLCPDGRVLALISKEGLKPGEIRVVWKGRPRREALHSERADYGPVTINHFYYWSAVRQQGDYIFAVLRQ